MPKNLLLYILFFGFTSVKLIGQDIEPIQIDRPDQTECPSIVPTHYIQIENGLSFEKVDDINSNFLYPSTLWKYGINENAEFRLITELISARIADTTMSGLTPITIGFKAKICEENGIIPKTSFIGHLTSPNWGSQEFEASFFAPAFRFTMQHTLSEKVSLSYNLGAEWDGETPEPKFIYTLTTGFSMIIEWMEV